MRRLANVQQGTIKPLIPATMTPGTWVSTDEYDLYSRLEQWGDAHENVCHSDGADARDDEGDGFCAMHVHTMEGFVVAAEIMAASASRHLAGACAALCGCLCVRPHRQTTR